MTTTEDLPPVAAAGPVSPLLTTDEAAGYLRVCNETVYALWRRRQLKMTKVGGRTFWRRTELDRYLEKQTREPRPRR